MHEKYPLSRSLRQFVTHCERYFPESIIQQGVIGQRTAYLAMTKSLSRTISHSLKISTRVVAGINTRHYQPYNHDKNSLSTVLYAHGGGWYLGNLDSHHNICADIAQACQVNLIAVDYRLAPEHPFPAGLNDCATVYQALITQGLDPILMGDSAGANIMASLSRQLSAQHQRTAKAQVLIYPALAEIGSLDSHNALHDAPLLSKENIRFCFQHYIPQSYRASEAFYPLQATSFYNAPPSEIIAAQYDPLIDDSLVYTQRLKASNINANCTVINGAVHGVLHAIGKTEEANLLFQAACKGLLKYC